jgi:hypothetical protein
MCQARDETGADRVDNGRSQQTAHSFDCLVDEGEQRGRHGEAERLGSG